ncbi:zeta toxin family protein, partial [Campylobacter fetus]
MAELIIVSGANGSGKSRLGNFLSKKHNIPFIDTDMYYKKKYGIYRNYSNEEMAETSIELKKLRNSYFKLNQSFIIERILNNPNAIKKIITTAKEYNFEVNMFYVGVDEITTLKNRINSRYLKGEHNVDRNTVLHNLKECKNNFNDIANMCDHVLVYDNSIDGRSLKLISEIENGNIICQNKIDGKTMTYSPRINAG